MQDLTVRTLGGTTKTLGGDALAALAAGLRGPVCMPGEAGYDEARTIWNGMIDRKPAAVVRCAGTSDVMKAVHFAGENDLLVAVRGGGHNIAGKAVCDGGLLIDLSGMRSVRVDPEGKTAWVEPGATLADFDKETQSFALTTPVGVNSTTGIAGLTLGGGFGWTTRKLGMTIDNLTAVDIVTADARRIRASDTENADLFWAVRGGGGNFGIVTGFEFRLHPLGPEVMSGLVVHPFENAPGLLRQYREFVKSAPDELTCWVVMRKAPPLPFLPEAWHGKEVLIFAACYAGDMAEGEKAMATLRGFGDPIADVISPHPFAGWQAAFDPLLTPGARNYWKSHNFGELADGALDKFVEYGGKLPSPECEIFIAHLGGAMGRVASDATAYAGRDAEFILNVHTRWQDPADDDTCIAWARDFFRATRPFAMDTVYINFLTEEEEEDRLARAYDANFARLADVKARYDPNNLFRVNLNIAPRAASKAAE